MNNTEIAIRKAMGYYKDDFKTEGYSGNDRMAFMNIARKAIEEFILLERVKQ